MEQLQAVVSATIFRNEENGYSVLTVRADKQPLTVVGVLPALYSGEQVVFTGEWINHPSYGRQFRASGFEIRTPESLQGLQRYLASGAIHGIGDATAALIVAHFGEETLSVLTDHPERLTEIKGIGKIRAAEIAESFREGQEERLTLIFLQTCGISGVLAERILKQYGADAPEIIRENPWRLCAEVEGVGFRTADRVGRSLDVPLDSAPRIDAALVYTLQEAAAAAGHLYLPEADYLSSVAALLQLPEELCRQRMTALLIRKQLIAETVEESRLIFLPRYWRAEKEVALRLRQLQCASSPGRFPKAASRIAAFERKHAIRFSALQRSAIVRALETGVLVITGGPGTGKTTLINCILSLLSEDRKVVLCAPTGRAARRMKEATGHEAATIHRLLEYSAKDETFGRNEEKTLDAGCIIVDESSMIDILLMRALLRAIEPGTRLILVGDADQLPSVGPGNVLGDVLESGQIYAVRLTDIFRQSQQSRIVVNAHRVNQGKMPLLNEKGTDFFFDRCAGPVQAAETILSLLTDRLPKFFGFPPELAADQAIRNIQVLSPTRKGGCGVNELNLRLQAALNPPSPGRPQIVWKEIPYRLGDKVMQIRNNYHLAWVQQTPEGSCEGEGVFNGDIGFITHVDTESGEVTVLFDEDKEVHYADDGLSDLELAYCLSVHKSQGGEFPVVVLPVVGGPSMLLTRNLFYTALTRARKMVVLVGREEIIRQMTENDHEVRRWTLLARRLQETEALLR